MYRLKYMRKSFIFLFCFFSFVLSAKKHKQHHPNHREASPGPVQIDSLKPGKRSDSFDEAVAKRVDTDRNMKIVLCSIGGLIVILIISSSLKKRRKRKEELAEKQFIKERMDFAYGKDEILENHYKELQAKFDSLESSRLKKLFELALNKKKKLNELYERYGTEIAIRILNNQYWVGMTEEQLREAKGDPDKIEVEVMKTKTKRIYIYGNKSSGDVFNFVNGSLERFKDR